MKKLVLVLFIVVLVAGLMLPALAAAHPNGQGKGCGCHRVAMLEQGSVHNGYIASGGANGGAAVCMKCH